MISTLRRWVMGLAGRLAYRLLPARLLRRKYLLGVPLAGLFVLVLAFAALKGRAPLPPAAAPSIEAGALGFTVPDRVAAGDGFRVVVSGAGESDSQITLFVETGYRLFEYEAVSVDGSATFDVAAIDGPAAGEANLTAVAGNRTGNSTVTITPGPAADPLELFLGPRTVEANAISGPMLAVVPRDRFGNPMADGTAVHVDLSRPDFARSELELQTRRLLAWSRIRSGTLAGRSRVAVSVGDASGKEMDFLEIAGTPEPFEVFALDPPAPADGRTVVQFRTGELRDVHGNPMPDGMNVFANVTGPGGTRRLASQSVGGLAEFSLEAPIRPGIERVAVVASGTVSSPLEIEFFPMVEDFPAHAEMTADGVLVTVGPVVGATNAYVHDGTLVSFESEHGLVEEPLFEGMAQVQIPVTRAPITVEVLGATTTTGVEAGP